ncbi:hypothetical protein [Jeotgalibacillus campisalis]|uniref:Uncharacterized protein n=1 Tax=Jeotgalibacillus campisalis TaxID=220754 RepID=A0A0C2SAY3_9BACL|nr:hypothetical protein [Jeotgalibacillus campisalis]KIL51099.1 hypothetical protein KR50_09800 [Jeotgalibacillus campisalis]
MEGIMLINKEYSVPFTPCSVTYQHMQLVDFVQKHQIHLKVLNPHQIHPFYTIPDALLYDLKRKNQTIDVLLLYSADVFNQYEYIFPDYWNKLLNHFDEVRYVM